MNIRFGSQTFSHVRVPILWGKRALIGHPSGALSIVDLGGPTACPEVVMDKPWSNIEYSDKEDGYIIFKDGVAEYFFSPVRKIVRDMKGRLPECEISERKIRIGTNTIQDSAISGSEVGVGISEDGFFIGGPLPAGLSELIVQAGSIR